MRLGWEFTVANILLRKTEQKLIRNAKKYACIMPRRAQMATGFGLDQAPRFPRG
jgi:hypothetical protein